MENFEIDKVMKGFCVIGFDENKISKDIEEEDKNIKYLNSIDIFQASIKYNSEKIENENEKW